MKIIDNKQRKEASPPITQRWNQEV